MSGAPGSFATHGIASGPPPRGRGPARRRTPVVALPLATIPRATYRVQLHRDFTFNDVTALVPYLDALGISHVYCSPYLRARPGSRHGYDIVDHRMLNPEIGSREDFDRMVEVLARHGMSHLCDVVPNHMAVMGADNAWWMDVLENGPSSAYSTFFDIDWTPRDVDLAGKVLLPVLGNPYGAVLQSGEIQLRFESESGAFAFRYFEHRFPLDPSSYVRVLGPALADATLDPQSAADARRLVAALAALPARDHRDTVAIEQRQRDSRGIKLEFAALVARCPALAAEIGRVVGRVNGTPGEPVTYEALHELLEAQAYRLAHWRVAADEINYRRFSDVNELAGLRIENEDVFDATHAFVLGLAADGRIGGLRIDHPDGLFDPAGYFARLQQRYRERARARGTPATPGGIYVVLEKITATHEHLPETWPVHGTTGYRFANVLNGLFVDRGARKRVDRAWRAFVGDEAHTFDQAACRGRRKIAEGALASELAVLTLRAHRIARADRRTRDFTFNTLREAIKEIVAHFPVYRTYVDADGASAQDRRYIDWALARARAESHVSDARVFDFLRDILLGQPLEAASPEVAEGIRHFAMRFQQFTAPVVAKGVEDTAFYTFNRLVSLNEVGGDPDQFGMAVRAFHGASAHRSAAWPHTMLASSTHDNKRSEDVRARIDVISELPAAWRLAVRRWSRMNRSRRRVLNGLPAPSRNDEYLLYQTLAGTFPPQEISEPELDSYRERIERYMVKAAREAKVRTSWFATNSAYEDALQTFVHDLLHGPADAPFLADLRATCTTFAWFGMLNSVSMTLIKLASPGVPDIYQGNEILDWSLVDPDNRRAVDYGLRQQRLASLEGLAGELAQGQSSVRSLFDSPYDGRAKLWVISRALALRRAQPALFAEGDYRRIAVSGARADQVVAFARTLAHDGVVVVAGRLFTSFGLPAGTLPRGEIWDDTALEIRLPSGHARAVNVLNGERFELGGAIRLARLCADFPGALLHATG